MTGPDAVPDLVIPTVGRPALGRLLASLAAQTGPLPARIVVADDRRDRRVPLDLTPAGALAARITVVPSGGRGPAAARNAGWVRCRTPWVAFLDDDVVAPPDWTAGLVRDVLGAGPRVAGVTGRVTVPLPADRRPTDRERGVAGLRDALWITADIAYRRDVLETVGGFDERFPRAYREDADIALRVRDAGYVVAPGLRRIVHPVGPAGPLASVRAQRGNADDMLMRALHGPDWRHRAGAGRGSKGHHAGLMAVLFLAGGALAARRRRAAGAALLVWAGGTVRFAARRIAPGPRTPAEVGTMLVTSALIPPAATWHAARGWVRARRLTRPGSEAPTVGRAPGADLGGVVPAEPAPELPVLPAPPHVAEPG
jgi:hypothetical protein